MLSAPQRALLHSGPRIQLGLKMHWHLDHQQQQDAVGLLGSESLAAAWLDFGPGLHHHHHARAVVASGGEAHSSTRPSASVSASLSVRLSVRYSLSLNGTSRDAPAKDRRERISTVDPCST